MFLPSADDWYFEQSVVQLGGPGTQSPTPLTDPPGAVFQQDDNRPHVATW